MSVRLEDYPRFNWLRGILPLPYITWPKHADVRLGYEPDSLHHRRRLNSGRSGIFLPLRWIFRSSDSDVYAIFYTRVPDPAG